MNSWWYSQGTFNCLPRRVIDRPVVRSSITPSLRDMDNVFVCIHYIFLSQNKSLEEDKIEGPREDKH